MIKRVSIKRYCYYCGAEGTSKEHCPPKFFFPKENRENMITVPSCDEHNNAKSKFDEYVFQLIVGSLYINKKHELDRYLLNKIVSSFKNLNIGNRPPTVHNFLERKHMDVRMEVVKDHPSQKHEMLTYSVGINYEAVNEFMVSLGKALIFHEQNLIFNAHNVVMPHTFGQDPGTSAADLSKDIRKIMAPLNEWKGSYRDIFLYYIFDAEKGKIVDMIFYSRFHASVIFSNIEEIIPQ